VEPVALEFASSLDIDLSIHFARFASSPFDVVRDKDATAYADALMGAASLLVDARVQAIGWYGSRLGMNVDRELCERLEAQLKLPVTTTLLALSDALRELGVKRYGLVTSCPESVRSLIVAALEQEGFACVRASASATISERLLAEAARSDARALVVVGPRLEVSPTIEPLERTIGMPLVASSVATAWRTVRLAGVADPSIGSWGPLLGATKR
jgi:maleate isomerase